MTSLNKELPITYPLARLSSQDFEYTDHKEELLERFAEDTENAKMSILRDEGDYRHLRINGSGFFWAEIITAPNFLSVHGDMGTYVFDSTDNMIDFFNKDHIKSRYWAQKCVSHNRYSSEVTVPSESKVLDFAKELLESENNNEHSDDFLYTPSNEEKLALLEVLKSSHVKIIDHYEYVLQEFISTLDNEDFARFVESFKYEILSAERDDFTQFGIHFEHSLASILAMSRTYAMNRNS